MPKNTEGSGQAPRIAIVHTSFLAVESFSQLFEELAPDILVRHIVDDSLLPEVIEAGCVNDSVHSRLCDLFRAAGKSGADLIFSQCSSVGEVADAAAALYNKPPPIEHRRNRFKSEQNKSKQCNIV